MGQPVSERRMAENEVIFRRYNERIQKELRELKKIAAEERETALIPDDSPLQYYCECSDEDCRDRILLEPTNYSKIHKDRNRFIIIPKHNTVKIEKIIKKYPTYWIVEKYITPSTHAEGLKKTDVNNT